MIFLVLFSFTGFSNQSKVIIDTDCAFDDLQAINILLSRTDVDIYAIIASEGSLNPDEGADKIRSLLHEWNKDKIPVIKGKEINGPAPQWRSFNQKISWGHFDGETPIYAFDFFNDLSNSEVTFTFICLGTLTSANILRNDFPGFFKTINRIIWYNNSVYPPEGFNYNYDRSSADVFLKDCPVRLEVISNLNNSKLRFNQEITDNINTGSKLSEQLKKIYIQPAVREKIEEGHFFLHDELIPVYYLNPELFDMTIKLPETKIRFTEHFNCEAVKEVFIDLIEGKYENGNNVVFNAFPSKREFFNYDVRQIMDSAISRYGAEEWKACVITDEFHGHLGVFSIVGAKMGIKAREIFNVGPDYLTVFSFAGSVPPYSCINDGIQVSTGATLGQGTIEVSADSITRPEAIFRYKGKSMKLVLKKEYLDRVNKDISEGIVLFGLADDGYWKMVRQSALRYWVEWDRNKIFEVIELQ